MLDKLTVSASPWALLEFFSVAQEDIRGRGLLRLLVAVCLCPLTFADTATVISRVTES